MGQEEQGEGAGQPPEALPLSLPPGQGGGAVPVLGGGKEAAVNDRRRTNEISKRYQGRVDEESKNKSNKIMRK